LVDLFELYDDARTYKHKIRLSMSTSDLPCQCHFSIALYQRIPDAIYSYQLIAYLKLSLPL